MPRITKAVFPVAGYGTRFLPVTKTIPKEMLPIVDKPVIQYAVTEVIAAGITELIFITSHDKACLENYFRPNDELEKFLGSKNRNRELQKLRQIIPGNITCHFVVQAQQLGLGHAVLCAKNIVGNEPFVVILPDDLIKPKQSYCLQEMLEIYTATGNSVIAVQEVAPEKVAQYGVVALAEGDPSLIKAVVEKPNPIDAPSNLAIVGRYILPPEIFKLLAETKPGTIGEIQLTDAIAKLLGIYKVNICKFTGKRYDCGSKLGYLEAVIAYALEQSSIANKLSKLLRE